ncbi:MAG: twin-arginine translocase TatA/TatE family subunit [Nitrospiria bacterium]
MFGIGISELLLILLIAFLVLGPEKVLALSRTIGRITADLKRKKGDVEKMVLSELNKSDETESSPDKTENDHDKHA